MKGTDCYLKISRRRCAEILLRAELARGAQLVPALWLDAPLGYGSGNKWRYRLRLEHDKGLTGEERALAKRWALTEKGSSFPSDSLPACFAIWDGIVVGVSVCRIWQELPVAPLAWPTWEIDLETIQRAVDLDAEIRVQFKLAPEVRPGLEVSVHFWAHATP
jgi:hypothetical protein